MTWGRGIEAESDIHIQLKVSDAEYLINKFLM
jgi:hypothetical protein